MSDETVDTSASEPIADATQTASEPATAEAPVDNTPESALSPDDVWSSQSLFNTSDESSDTDKDDAETKGKDDALPDSLPSDTVAETQTDDETKTDLENPDEVKDESDKDEEDEGETAEAAASSVLPLPRKEFRKVEKDILTPFRDPDAPIETAVEGLFKLNPNRAMDMATYIVRQSVREHPNEWLNTLLGTENLSVEEVKQRIEGNGSISEADVALASTAAPASIEQQPHVKSVIAALDEVYGDSWRDPANDDMLLLDDKDNVLAFRAMLQRSEAEQSEKERLKAEIEALKPQIEQLKTNDEADLENKISAAYNATTTEYRKTVESKALDELFPKLGFDITAEDSEQVKAVKKFAQDRFSSANGEGSDLDDFIAKESPDRELMGKIVARVDKYIQDASEAEVKAARTKDKAAAATLLANAQSYKAEAEREQDRIVVLYNKAAKTYAEQKLAPIMAVLAENADLQRRLNVNSGARTEVIGSTAIAANGNSWRDNIAAQAKQGTNPFDMDIPLVREAGR